LHGLGRIGAPLPLAPDFLRCCRDHWIGSTHPRINNCLGGSPIWNLRMRRCIVERRRRWTERYEVRRGRAQQRVRDSGDRCDRDADCLYGTRVLVVGARGRLMDHPEPDQRPGSSHIQLQRGFEPGRSIPPRRGNRRRAASRCRPGGRPVPLCCRAIGGDGRCCRRAGQREPDRNERLRLARAT
jgi:hypothetical protein